MKNYTLNNAVPFPVHNTASTAAECARAAAFYQTIIENPEHFPCSFELDGISCHGFDIDFILTDHTVNVESQKQSDTLTFQHISGILVTAACVLYPKHAAMEWTLYIKNGHPDQNSPRIRSLKGADICFQGKLPRLRGILGDARNEAYGSGDKVISPTYGMNNQPYDIPLAMGVPYEMHPEGGCSCNHEFPYFNLQTLNDNTTIAIGWPGQWKSEFFYSPEGIHFTAGQQIMDAYLYPGEEIRTPLICFMFSDGNDDERRINLWRRFMMECNMPRQNSVISQPILCSNTLHTDMMVHATEENQIDAIRELRKNGIVPDVWWMDAGWYNMDVNGNPPIVVDDYGFTGSWEMCEEAFPTGLRAISDCMAETGGKTLLWFEPERCGLDINTLREDGTTLKKEWLLNGYQELLRPRDNGDVIMPMRFVNLGNPEAAQWLCQRITSILEKGNIGIYREDHNIRPLMYWQASDTSDRMGMTENKYITAHLWLWDTLRERFNGMIIDSCASGGRRNDLESMRRAVPLHYSDFFIYDLTRHQAVQSSLYQWFPYLKSEGLDLQKVDDSFEYRMNTAMAPFTIVNTAPGMYDGEAGVRARAYINSWNDVNKYFYADYYLLTKWNIDDSQMLAWEFIDSVSGSGFIQIFRRPWCTEDSVTLFLKGLMENQTYHITGIGCDLHVTATGAELVNGVTVTMPPAPSAAVLKITSDLI